MNPHIRYALALTRIKGLGLHTLKQLFEHYPTPQDIFTASSAQLLRIPKVRNEVLQDIIQKSTLQEADNILARCQRLGIRLLFFQDEAYPELLKHIHLPPMLLYAVGDITLCNQQPSVALMGTRRITSYGQRQTTKLCEALKPHKVNVICGFGIGVERCATQEALRQGLFPVIVYPAGLQHPYPSTTPIKLIEQARRTGCLISEHPPDEPLQRHAFLARNRIIIGLSQQIVIIESAEMGGSMQLARLAQAENREVHALPGDIDKTRSQGTNRLIRHNVARALTSPNDLLSALNLQALSPQQSMPSKQASLNEEENKIIEVLGTYEKGTHIDLIAERTKFSIDQLSMLLFNLESQNIIEFLPGNSYRLRAR